MNNLGGHDMPSVLEAFHNADPEKPTCFICYTVKGFGLPFAGHKDNHAGLMTPQQMETFRQATDVRPGHEWEKFEGLALPAEQLQSFLDRVPFAAGGARRLSAPALDVPDSLAGHHPASDVHANRLRRDSQRDWPRQGRLRTSHRHHIAGRHGVHQSRTLGEPARPVCTSGHGRYIQERAHSIDVQLGVLAQGPAYRTRHRRDEPVHPAFGAWPVPQHQWRALAADRHAVRSLHRARPRCAQLCLLSGRALHAGGNAVRHHAGGRRWRASIDSRAIDRVGAGWARQLRASLRRRACRHHALGLFLYAEGRRRGAIRT